MPPHFTILYVSDVTQSSAFYAKYLARPIVDSSPAFAVLPLSDSSLLGLWQRDMVQPTMDEQVTVGMMELAIPVVSNSLVDTMYAQWGAQGVTLVQAPTQLPFGYTFTAQDPDGHRLRIWCPSADVQGKADAEQ